MGPAVLTLIFPDLPRQALRAGAALVLVLVLALAFVISSLGALFGRITPGGEIPTVAPEAVPKDQLVAMESAAGTCGLPWQVLAAVARVESDFGRNMATSSAGAIGYGQFLPSTWAAYGGDGNPYDYRDALPAMARYLCANGGTGDLRGALFAYNHAGWYVDEVLAAAMRYGYVPPGAPAARVLDLAKAQIGTPYVWGGSSPGGFDCSGLVQWVYSRVGLSLPRTAQLQFDATERVAPSELRPGDLVFFQDTYPSPDGITHVGIYIGAGYMLNAPAEGDVVRQMPLSSPFWASHYAGAGRVRGLA
ncbi:MAG TPA: bifunctional lytic transglycosylase/C40 family peptidase [Chloroflexota bacterium]|nr:bifunctional lytic transglycosylase/C40 family peptidase [Chloroflexota bacterium]